MSLLLELFSPQIVSLKLIRVRGKETNHQSNYESKKVVLLWLGCGWGAPGAGATACACDKAIHQL